MSRVFTYHVSSVSPHDARISLGQRVSFGKLRTTRVRHLIASLSRSPLGLQYSSLLTSNSGWCRRPAKGLTRSFRGCIPHTLYLPHDAHGRQRVGTIGQVMGGQLRIRKSGRVFSAKAPSLVHSRTLITTQIQPHSNPFLNTLMLCPK